jgi:CHASE3 domain sensor protein
MSEALETHEHAEHAAEGGRKHTALLIAILATGLAFCEQGAQHADTHMTEDAVAATDTWAEYQAKSIRANEARDFAVMASVLPATDALAAVQTHFKQDAEHFENDPRTGKAAIAAKAKALEAARDHAHERLEAFDNAAAALQLAIVITTASVITGSLMLVYAGAALGLLGGFIAILGLIDPAMAAL